MPRKRKSQKQNGQGNALGLDAPSSTENTAQSSTRSTREKGAALKQASALGEYELGDRASWHTRNQDREKGGIARVDRIVDNHTPTKHDARPISSTTTNLNSRPKPKTWASPVEHGHKASTTLNMRLTGLEEKKEQLSLEVQMDRNLSEKNVPTVEEVEDTIQSFAKAKKAMKETMRPIPPIRDKKIPLQDLKDFSNSFMLGTPVPMGKETRRAIPPIRDKKIPLKDLENFSKSFIVGTPVPMDLIPILGLKQDHILARDRLRQDRILARLKLATNVKEQEESSNEEKTSTTWQPLQESPTLKGQEWIENTTLLLNSSKDDQTGSLIATTSDVDSLGTTLPQTLPWSDQTPQPYLPNKGVAYHDVPFGPFVRPLEPVRSERPWMRYSLAEQRNSYTPQSPSMEAIECGLGVIRHYTFPRGTLIPFQTIRNLGRGSMAHVEEVHMPHHRSFVRKTFLLTMSSDLRPRCRDIIHREMVAMRRFQHVHIVRVIGSYDLEPITSTILMSPVGDNDLKMFLDELEETPPGTREWEERRSWLWKWIRCLTSAVAYIHSQGICHKDIKPSNIVHKGDDVYLTDFSSCDQFNVGGTTSTGADARTTLLYRAPELFRTGDAGKHGPGTDIFALGLVFLEMKAVYWGTTVKHLRESYDATASVKSATNEFYYGNALTQIHVSLNTTRGNDETWPLSSQVIQSMLASERKERPSAVQILDEYRLVTSDACVCTMIKSWERRLSNW